MTPVAAVAADDAPAEENYVLNVPDAGADAGADGSGGGQEDGAGATAAAADSADEGGLPILLIVLAGTALAGAIIAIMRRQQKT